MNLPQLDENFKDAPISAAAADYRLRIEWRKLRNQVANESAVKGALATANAAKTDLEKRKLLGHYYELLYGKMLARAATPEIKAYLYARKADQLRVLPQPHVRPEATPAGSPKSSPPAAAPRPAPTALPTPDVLPPLGAKRPTR